jgi:Na+/H+ antiporter NhaA
MSLYIASKAFPDTADFTAVKVAIFLASAIAGVTGALLLYLTGRRSGP